ncbi:hypothetical protein BOX15_Mlig017605g2, partial [Macrostomum lignano]
PDLFTPTCSPRPVHTNLFTSTCSPQAVHTNLFTPTCSPQPVHPNLFTPTCSPRPVQPRDEAQLLNRSVPPAGRAAPSAAPPAGARTALCARPHGRLRLGQEQRRPPPRRSRARRVVDCDRLGHAAYAPGTACHRRLLAEFGPEIAPDGPDGAIDRKALGRRVFADQSARQRLNDIVWPEIRRLALEAVHSGPQSASPDVVVLDAAVLLEAEWQCLCHEVWLCLIPKREAVKRLTERDGLTEEAAQARLAAQLTDADRLSWASVALCTLWEPEATQAQVELAWKRLLRERLGATPGPQSNL